MRALSGFAATRRRGVRALGAQAAWLTAVAAAAVALGPRGACAQAADGFPSRPITIVVPYAPGGSNDVFARLIAKGLGDAFKQPVVVENRPGASGNTGTAQVARAAPDGYTLVAVSSSFTTNAAIQPRLPFDAVRSFSPVAMMAKGPFIVTVNSGFPARTPRELIAELKAHPGRYNYATSGVGSSNQFATEMLKAMSGTYVVHVAYRGMGPAVTDLAGNQVQLLIGSGPSLMPHVRSGRIRAIGITSAAPSPIAPDLTPMASVIPGYDFELWWGLLAPAGTPPELVGRLNAEVNRVIGTPEVREFLLREGAVPTPMTPAQFGAVIASDIPRWQAIARRQSIQPE